MGTQLDCSLTFSPAEAAYGTVTTTTKAVEFTDESFDWDPTWVQGQGMRVGSRVARSGRRKMGRQQAPGDITVEAVSKGLGFFLKAALGQVTTTQRATTGVFQQNHSLTQANRLESYTVQKGIPRNDAAGTIDPYTFPGATCQSIEFDCPNSDLVTVKTSWMAREVLTATAYAAPSYPTPLELFSFVNGALVIGGTVTPASTTALATGGTAVANIRDWNVSLDNHMDDGGFNLGGGGKRVRPQSVGMAELKGKVTAEYDSTALRDAWIAQTPLDMVLTLMGTTVIGTGSDVPALQIRIPNIQLEGEIPKSNGGDVITQSIDFTGMDNLVAASPLFVSYVSTDTAP